MVDNIDFAVLMKEIQQEYFERKFLFYDWLMSKYGVLCVNEISFILKIIRDLDENLYDNIIENDTWLESIYGVRELINS